MDQICAKWLIPIENRKFENNHRVLHIQISLGTKFQLKLEILIFWSKFAQKGYFCSKTTKVRICIFKLALVPNFSLNWLFWLFGPNLPKKGKAEKVNTTTEFCIFGLVLVLGFSLNWQFWIPSRNFRKKRISGGNHEKWTSPLNSEYSN